MQRPYIMTEVIKAEMLYGGEPGLSTVDNSGATIGLNDYGKYGNSQFEQCGDNECQFNSGFGQSMQSGDLESGVDTTPITSGWSHGFDQPRSDIEADTEWRQSSSYGGLPVQGQWAESATPMEPSAQYGGLPESILTDSGTTTYMSTAAPVAYAAAPVTQGPILGPAITPSGTVIGTTKPSTGDLTLLKMRQAKGQFRNRWEQMKLKWKAAHAERKQRAAATNQGRFGTTNVQPAPVYNAQASQPALSAYSSSTNVAPMAIPTTTYVTNSASGPQFTTVLPDNAASFANNSSYASPSIAQQPLAFQSNIPATSAFDAKPGFIPNTAAPTMASRV